MFNPFTRNTIHTPEHMTGHQRGHRRYHSTAFTFVTPQHAVPRRANTPQLPSSKHTDDDSMATAPHTTPPRTQLHNTFVVAPYCSESMQCDACTAPWVDPVKLVPCGHVVCLECARTLRACPHCSAVLAGHTEVLPLLRALVGGLRGSCSKCEWSGLYSAYIADHAAVCPDALQRQKSDVSVHALSGSFSTNSPGSGARQRHHERQQSDVSVHGLNASVTAMPPPAARARRGHERSLSETSLQGYTGSFTALPLDGSGAVLAVGTPLHTPHAPPRDRSTSAVGEVSFNERPTPLPLGSEYTSGGSTPDRQDNDNDEHHSGDDDEELGDDTPNSRKRHCRRGKRGQGRRRRAAAEASEESPAPPQHVTAAGAPAVARLSPPAVEPTGGSFGR